MELAPPQDVVHLPSEQTVPAPQLVPQVPQFVLSVFRLAQKLTLSIVQMELGPPQDVAHLPSEQTVPAPQLVPQVPQFVLSVFKLAQ